MTRSKATAVYVATDKEPMLDQLKNTLGEKVKATESICCCSFFSQQFILRVSDHNGVSPLYIMLEIHHSGWEPSNFIALQFCSWQFPSHPTFYHKSY